MDFKNTSELLALCQNNNIPISEVMRLREVELGETSDEEVNCRMTHALEIMKKSSVKEILANKSLWDEDLSFLAEAIEAKIEG